MQIINASSHVYLVFDPGKTPSLGIRLTFHSLQLPLAWRAEG